MQQAAAEERSTGVTIAASSPSGVPHSTIPRSVAVALLKELWEVNVKSEASECQQTLLSLRCVRSDSSSTVPRLALAGFFLCGERVVMSLNAQWTYKFQKQKLTPNLFKFCLSGLLSNY